MHVSSLKPRAVLCLEDLPQKFTSAKTQLIDVSFTCGITK